VGLVLGAFAGILFAFLRDRLDKRLRSRQEVEAATGSLLLGVVPATNGSKRDSAHRLVTLDTEEDGAAEAYRALRANLLAVAGQEAGRILMVTSPLADEGETTVVANLAVAMAQLVRRVVVVSADLREPTLHRLFQLRSGPGLAEVLAGRVDSVRSVVKQPKVPHLWVVSSGKPAKRPAESLHSERMRQVLDELRQEADFVILDCPPVLPVSDCLALAPLVDGVLVVVDPRTTTRDALVRACQDLELVGGRLIGTVVNKYVARTGGFVPRYDRYGGRRPYPHSPSSNGGGRKQARKEREARPIQAT
jgi:capsular exopolysaccharide synthesis family protein